MLSSDLDSNFSSIIHDDDDDVDDDEDEYTVATLYFTLNDKAVCYILWSSSCD